MKYVKMLGLLAVAAAALMAFAGTASAVKLTSPAGTTWGVGNEIKAESKHSFLDGSVDVTCATSHVTGKITAETTEHVTGSVDTLSFTECVNDTVTVLKKGTLTIDTNGTIWSSGAEVTVQLHRTVVGFPVTTHCIYKTENTKIGEFTGGTPAKMDINSEEIKQVSTDGACGEKATWTGSYTVTSPGTLLHDAH